MATDFIIHLFLKNSALMQHSSSDQSLYGVWRYELTQEECEITLPVLISVNKKTTDDDEIDASNGALVMWDAESEKPKYEGTSYEVNVTALSKTNEVDAFTIKRRNSFR